MLHPVPVTWFYNGGDLGGGVKVGDNGTLTIVEPLVRHSGIYQCVVENRFGEARMTWLLEVREPGKKKICLAMWI